MIERELSEIMPLLGVEHDCILSKAGEITAGFTVALPELFSLGSAEYESFHGSWVKALKILTPGTVLHKQDWFTAETYRADFGCAETFLSRASERFFNERPYLNHRCQLYLTRMPQGRKPSTSAFCNLLRKRIVPAEALSATLREEFLDTASQFTRILEDTGLVKFQRLKNAELLSSEGRAGAIEQYCFLLNGKELMVKDISYQDGIRIGDDICQLYSLSSPDELPALCGPRITLDKYSTDRSKFSSGFAAELGQLLSTDHIYNQYIFIGDAQETLKLLESKRRRLQSLSIYSRENAIARDATSDFLQEAIAEQRMPVKAHFNILVWAKTKAELGRIRGLVTAALARMDAVPKLETDGAPQVHWAGIPGNAADLPINDCFNTFSEQACCLLNLESNATDSPSALGIRLGDRLSGRPIHVDISDEPMSKGIITNRNKFILGPSGSGKSFFTNHMMRSYHEQGAHIVLVDVGHSYRGLTELVKGYYFSYSEKKPFKFNPFYIPAGEEPDTEKKESIKTLLVALWKKEREGFNRSEYVALSSALKLYYEKLQQHPEILAGFNSFYEFLQSDYTRVLETDRVKEKDFDASNFLYVLRPYYAGGEYDYLLNGRKNLDLLQQPFIVFELDSIKDHPILFPVVTLIIMEVFISKMRKLPGLRKIILIEEAWKAIAREGMAEYIKYLFKTVRKFFGEAIVVTQEIEDILSSPVVKQSIIHNSDCKILFDQSKYQNKFTEVQELLGLSEKEKTMVLSINKANDPNKKYKEVFISLGGSWSRVYRTEVSPEEYFAYTTEETEKLKIMEYAEKCGSLEKGISTRVAELL